MSTDNRSRVHKGLSTGGQFATETRTEDPSISLATPPARDYEMIAEAQSALLSAKWENTNYSRSSESATSARYLTALIRQKYPEAATARMFIPGDGSRYTLHSISDAEGKILGSEGTNYDEFEEFVHSDGTWEALSSIDTAQEDPATSPYLDVEYHVSGENQTATLRLDDAMDNNPFEESSVKRGEQTVKGYQALHDDPEDAPETVVRNMLTDLHLWARANDVDLHEVFDRADRYATEEENDAAPAAEGKSNE